MRLIRTDRRVARMPILSSGSGIAAALLLTLGAALQGEAAGSGSRPDLYGVAGTSNTGCAAGQGVLLYSSSVHLNWFVAQGADPSLAYTAVTAAGGRFVAVAEDGSVWRSRDAAGTVFDEVAATGAGMLHDVRVIGPYLVAVGSGGAIVRSGDLLGGNWTSVNSPVPETLRAVAGNGVSSVAVGDNGTLIRGGMFGNEWAEVSIAEDRGFLALTVNPYGQYLAVGERGVAWMGQPDGLTWTRLASPTTGDLHGACSVGTATVLVGGGGLILHSPGGYTDWVAQISPATRDLHAVAFTGSDVLAVGERTTVIWSLLGTHWSDVAIPVETESWGRLKRRFQAGRR